MFNESVHESQRLELLPFAGCAFPPLFCPETLSLVLAVVSKGAERRGHGARGKGVKSGGLRD